MLLLGKRIARTLELLNWVLVAVHPRRLPGARPHLRAARHLGLGAGGIHGLRHRARRLQFPARSNVDILLLGALVGYSGGGGVLNLTLSNWARDKGYGMGSRVGHIARRWSAARSSQLADTGFIFEPDAANMSRWRGWWRIVRVDQWGIFFVGALLGMMLPALLYVTFVAPGTDIKGLAISAVLAQHHRRDRRRRGWDSCVAVLGVWILFKTQLDCVEGMTRSITDILWTGSARVRAWRGGDVRAVYYTVLAVVVVWGIIALKLAQPVMLLQIGANIAGVVFVIASLHVLYLNTRVLPAALRPPMWRRVALVGMALFYGFFVVLVARSLILSTAPAAQRLRLISMPLPTSISTESMSPACAHARAIGLGLRAHALRQQHVVGGDDAARRELGMHQLEAGQVQVLPHVEQHEVERAGQASSACRGSRRRGTRRGSTGRRASAPGAHARS